MIEITPLYRKQMEENSGRIVVLLMGNKQPFSATESYTKHHDVIIGSAGLVGSLIGQLTAVVLVHMFATSDYKLRPQWNPTAQRYDSFDVANWLTAIEPHLALPGCAWTSTQKHLVQQAQYAIAHEPKGFKMSLSRLGDLQFHITHCGSSVNETLNCIEAAYMRAIVYLNEAHGRIPDNHLQLLHLCSLLSECRSVQVRSSSTEEILL